MDYAFKFITFLLLLLLLLDSAIFSINASNDDEDYNRCEGIVKTWSSSTLALDEIKEDKHLLHDFLFFLHIPRTGGRTYYNCSLECLPSYDTLQLDPSQSNCRLLATHDDYSVMSKLDRGSTSVVTILRNPVERVFSTYEFSVENAARFLVHPNLTYASRVSNGARSKTGIATELDIWPWKYLVPWMRDDLFGRRDARKHMSHTRSNLSYEMEEVVMPLREYINDPIALDIIHNGATFQVAGLTNNSYIDGARDIRHCVLKHRVLGEHVLAVAKKRLDNMLYVGLTEEHKESAAMFADFIGAQVISQLATSNNHTRASTVHNNRSGGSSFSDSSAHKNLSKIFSANENMTTGILMEAYETCISNLRDSQAQLRTSSLKTISLVNFTEEVRHQVPEVLLQEIESLNNLDMKLYKYAQDIFSNQHKHMNQKLSKTVDNNGKNMSNYSSGVGESQKKHKNMYTNLLTALAWNNNLWIAMSTIMLLLFITLLKNARGSTSKYKI